MISLSILIFKENSCLDGAWIHVSYFMCKNDIHSKYEVQVTFPLSHCLLYRYLFKMIVMYPRENKLQ